LFVKSELNQLCILRYKFPNIYSNNASIRKDVCKTSFCRHL